jgi:hypothetical protein
VTGFGLASADVVTWSGAALLVVAGLAKLRTPDVAAGFLGKLGFPPSRAIVRSLAAVELIVGGGVIVFAGSTLVVALGLYLSFGVVLLAYRAKTGAATISCGCFGSSASLPILSHLVALAAFAAAALAAIAADRASLPSVLRALSALEALMLIAALGLLVGSAVVFVLSSRPSSPSVETHGQFRVVTSARV